MIKGNENFTRIGSNEIDDILSELRCFAEINKNRTDDKGILLVPGNDKNILCYINGFSMFEILADGRWRGKVSTDHEKNFKDILDVNNFKARKVIKEEVKKIVKEKLDLLYNGTQKAGGKRPQDERRDVNALALKFSSFEYDKYSYCGVETSIPSKYFSHADGKRYLRYLDCDRQFTKDNAEFDLVLYNPGKNEIVLVEYKCKEYAMTGKSQAKDGKKYDKSNIKGHLLDYAYCLKYIEENNELHFKEEILKAYSVLAKINGQNYVYNEDTAKKATIKILFLLTANSFTSADKAKKILSKNFLENRKKDLKKFCENMEVDIKSYCNDTVFCAVYEEGYNINNIREQINKILSDKSGMYAIK